MILMLVFIGKYPLKYIATVLGIGLVALTLFVLIAKAFPNPLTTRVNTWEARIERFVKDDVTDLDEPIRRFRMSKSVTVRPVFAELLLQIEFLRLDVFLCLDL